MEADERASPPDRDDHPEREDRAPERGAPERGDPERGDPEHGDRHFPIVGIGASAGGIKALVAFFEHLPDERENMAFVVVQHLSPEHESRLAELLGEHTAMYVTQVSETTALQPGHVYVIPPDKNLSITDDELTPSEFEQPRTKRAPVDFFFRTLAETHGERAVGILLSGTGTGGTQGLGRIKERGGVTMVQDPDEAGYSGMARSAIAANLVDVVAPVAELAEQLADLYRRADRIDLPASPDDLSADGTRALHKIFVQLQSKTGHDFTHHKRASVLRRLHRRMQVVRAESLEGYLDHLHGHPDEVDTLFKDLLICVTSFFRDSEAFEALEKTVIPQLFANKEATDEVRVWVPGCATGEEAYSIAMLLREYAATHTDQPELQVFASDIDEDALAFARQGRYPDSIEADVSDERLTRFFSREDGGYRVGSELRDVVLFARHNLLSDPPFSHLDLISCRNLLIYLKSDAQEQLFDLFHYALGPGGHLFLGASENAESASGRFTTTDKTFRLYRRRTVSSSERDRLPRLPLEHIEPAEDAPPQGDAEEDTVDTSFGALHQRLLEHYAPPSVVIDAENDVVHLSDHAGRYLQMPGGELSQNILDLAHPDLRVDLRTTIYRARQEGEPSESKAVPVTPDDDEDERRVRLVVRPPAGGGSGDDDDFLLVIFDERTDEHAASPETEPAPVAETDDASLVEDLQSELRDTRERLQATIEEYETSNEEMKASNEELQSINEELRSTTEELETSKEELQSMNEELMTVNEELENKNEELERANNDLHNLITSTRIATLFLDRRLHLARYTEAATDLFDVIGADVGRPVQHLTHRFHPDDLADDRLAADAQQVLDTLEPIEREVRAHPPENASSPDGDEERDEWFLMRVLPYRTTDEKIDGVVLIFVDITERRRAEQRLEDLNETLEERVEERTDELRRRKARESALLRALPDPVLRISAEDVVEDVHVPEDADALPWPPGDLLGRPLREAFPERVAEALGDALHQTRETRQQVVTEVRLAGPEPPATVFEARLAPIDGAVTVSLCDISQRRRLEREMLEAGDRKQREIAEDLHDELGQRLMGAHFLSRSLRRRLPDEQDEIAADLDEIAGEIDAASDYVRNLSRMLAAVDTQEGRGLGEALQHLAKRTEHAFDVTCTYERDGDERDGAEHVDDEQVATSLYRIAQEAVTNAVRHAGASQITLRCLADEEGLLLRIEDDGDGIEEDVAARADGLGLRTMQHRANLIGARLDVSPRENDRGTVVSCLLSRSRLQQDA